MLWLKRVVNDYEFMKCHISDELIAYGDFYYEDDEDGLIIKARVYNELKEKARRDAFDYSKLEQATCQRDYERLLREAERELKTQTIFDRKVAKY